MLEFNFSDKVQLAGETDQSDWGVVTAVSEAWIDYDGEKTPARYGVTWKINRASGSYNADELQLYRRLVSWPTQSEPKPTISATGHVLHWNVGHHNEQYAPGDRAWSFYQTVKSSTPKGIRYHWEYREGNHESNCVYDNGNREFESIEEAKQAAQEYHDRKHGAPFVSRHEAIQALYRSMTFRVDSSLVDSVDYATVGIDDSTVTLKLSFTEKQIELASQKLLRKGMGKT